MKRKEEIIIRTNIGMAIFVGVGAIICFVLAVFVACSGPYRESPVFIIVDAIIVGSIFTSLSVQVFKMKYIVSLKQMKNGIIIIKDKKGRLFDLKISQIKYKIFNEGYILLQDNNYTLLLEKSKKLIRTLNELGALTKELK